LEIVRSEYLKKSKLEKIRQKEEKKSID